MSRPLQLSGSSNRHLEELLHVILELLAISTAGDVLHLNGKEEPCPAPVVHATVTVRFWLAGKVHPALSGIHAFRLLRQWHRPLHRRRQRTFWRSGPLQQPVKKRCINGLAQPKEAWFYRKNYAQLPPIDFLLLLLLLLRRRLPLSLSLSLPLRLLLLPLLLLLLPLLLRLLRLLRLLLLSSFSSCSSSFPCSSCSSSCSCSCYCTSALLHYCYYYCYYCYSSSCCCC